MKLSLAIICETLSHHGAKLDSDDSTIRDLTGARLFFEGVDIMPGYAYIVDVPSLRAFSDGCPTSGRMPDLVFIGSEDELEAALCERPRRAVVVPPDGDVNAAHLLAEIQDTFESLGAWERDVFTSIARHRSLQQTFDTCARDFENPIALFDSSVSLVIRTGRIPETLTGSIWEDILVLGHTRDEALSMPERRSDESRWVSGSTEPFFFQPQAYPKETELIAILYDHGKAIGSIGSVDINAPFTPAQVSLYGAIRELMEFAITARGGTEFLEEGAMPLIERLIGGGDVQRFEVADRILAARRFDMHDRYLACYVARGETAPMPEHVRDLVMSRIRQLADPAFLLPYDRGILVLFRMSRAACTGPDAEATYRGSQTMHRDGQAGDDRSPASRLRPILESLDLYCGVGMAIEDFMLLRMSFEQARMALTASGTGQAERIVYFEADFIRILLETVSSVQVLDAFCDPSIIALSLESERGLEDVKTLFSYLVSGRNASDTARMLNVHRNTLVYRLERISKKLGLDLETLEPDEIAFELFSCLVATRKATGTEAGHA